VRAFRLLRDYARTHQLHLIDVSRRLISDAEARGHILASMGSATVPPP
jgi:hypothetical protein